MSAQTELCKERGAGEVANQTFDGITVVDPETDVPAELRDSVNGNKWPLMLKISYFPTEWEMTYTIGSNRASAVGSVGTVRAVLSVDLRVNFSSF